MKRAFFTAIVLLTLAASARAERGPLEFRLTFDPAITGGKPFTGRVHVLLFREAITSLKPGPSWFRPDPFFAKDVKGWKPGEIITLRDDAVSYPVPVSRVPLDTWSIQAVMDFGRGINFCAAPGNGYARPIRRALDPATSGPVALHLDQIVPAKRFVETERVKLVDIESKLLSAFHGRTTRLRAGVILPESFAREPARRYPVVYEIPGFTGDHFMAFGVEKRNPTNVAGVEMLWVMLDPSCPLGHTVFADSANNGPCGRALIEELIPAIEAKFRAVGTPASRFVTGHSSGGWSSLWLQITYPDFFNGCWSTAPDPVDFRDWQLIDLYQPGANVFHDANGALRPIAKQGGKSVLWYKGFSDMEEVFGHGGQLASFDAVFSERGPDGKPLKLWDRKTGAVNPDVARSWQKYDIRLVLERNWKTLGPKLAGKLHVYMGDEDTFLLDGATRLLRQALQQLGSDAVVEMFPGRHHGNLIDKPLRERMNREMAERWRRR